MLKFNKVSFSYGDKKILSDFDLTIKNGERIALLGNSGSGKTTIMKLAAEIEKKQSGNIESSFVKASYIFQEDRLLPWCSAIENITFAGASEETAKGLLDKTGLSEYADKLPEELSGGMKRRLAIARALSIDADMFFIDEPLHGLDINSAKDILKLIAGKIEGKSALIITHSPEEAFALAQRVVIIGKRPIEILGDRKISEFKNVDELRDFIKNIL